MITASLFKNGQNQAVRLPKELEFTGVNKVEIYKQGNSIVITPVRKSWKSFVDVSQADHDFLLEREDVIDLGRVDF
jgi:antitoxin VapB